MFEYGCLETGIPLSLRKIVGCHHVRGTNNPIFVRLMERKLLSAIWQLVCGASTIGGVLDGHRGFLRGTGKRVEGPSAVPNLTALKRDFVEHALLVKILGL